MKESLISNRKLNVSTSVCATLQNILDIMSVAHMNTYTSANEHSLIHKQLLTRIHAHTHTFCLKRTSQPFVCAWMRINYSIYPQHRVDTICSVVVFDREKASNIYRIYFCVISAWRSCCSVYSYSFSLFFLNSIF